MSTFYEKEVNSGVRILSPEESRHCAQVLRHQAGDEIEILDGQGHLFTCRLNRVSKSACEFELISEQLLSSKSFRTHLAIAPTKNMDRMEWLIEKACEIGVDEISFLLTDHSERRKLKQDRLEKKVISALKQSKNGFKCQLNELVTFNKFVQMESPQKKWIAHVSPSNPHLADLIQPKEDNLILIGPEGDFSTEEVRLALSKGFEPISLGQSTLRTETAGFTACHIANVVNRY